MQAGRRTAIDNWFKSRNYPVEVTLYMYQGRFEKTLNLTERAYSKQDLNQKAIEMTELEKHDSCLINLLSKHQFDMDQKNTLTRTKAEWLDLSNDQYKFI